MEAHEREILILVNAADLTLCELFTNDSAVVLGLGQQGYRPDLSPPLDPLRQGLVKQLGNVFVLPRPAVEQAVSLLVKPTPVPSKIPPLGPAPVVAAARVSEKQLYRKKLSAQASRRQPKQSSVEAHEAEKARMRNAARIRQATMTPEQRADLAARRKAFRSAQTPEQREQERNRMRAYRSRFSAEKKAEVSARNRARPKRGAHNQKVTG